MIGDMIGGGHIPSVRKSDADEAYARQHCTEAAVVIDKILRGYSVCEEGRRIAWRSAKIIQKAIDDARRGE